MVDANRQTCRMRVPAVEARRRGAFGLAVVLGLLLVFVWLLSGDKPVVAHQADPIHGNKSLPWAEVSGPTDIRSASISGMALRLVASRTTDSAVRSEFDDAGESYVAGTVDEDSPLPLDRINGHGAAHEGTFPWLYHAYNPVTGWSWSPAGPLLPTARAYSDIAMDKAVGTYQEAAATSDPEERNARIQRAYWWLGRSAHLLQDVSTPAHAHGDPHAAIWPMPYVDFVHPGVPTNWFTSITPDPFELYEWDPTGWGKPPGWNDPDHGIHGHRWPEFVRAVNDLGSRDQTNEEYMIDAPPRPVEGLVGDAVHDLALRTYEESEWDLVDPFPNIWDWHWRNRSQPGLTLGYFRKDELIRDFIEEPLLNEKLDEELKRGAYVRDLSGRDGSVAAAYYMEHRIPDAVRTTAGAIDYFLRRTRGGDATDDPPPHPSCSRDGAPIGPGTPGAGCHGWPPPSGGRPDGETGSGPGNDNPDDNAFVSAPDGL